MQQWQAPSFEQIDICFECTAYTMTKLDDLMIEWNDEPASE